jgi:hypothetical protein
MNSSEQLKNIISKVINTEHADFELADTNRCSMVLEEIDEILKVLGHKEALVTDESYITDFICVFAKPEEIESSFEMLRKELGVEIIDKYDKVVEVAERMKNASKNKS